MSSFASKENNNWSIWSESDVEVRPMNIRRGRRIYDSDEESNMCKINSKFLLSKKRIRILELSDSSTDDDVATDFRSSFEKNDQKIRKIKRNRGEKYYTKTGNITPAKKFKNKDCNCKKLCEKRITENSRISIFNSFWEMGDFNKQNTFLSATTQRVPIKRRRVRNLKGSARDCSYKYFLNIEIESIEVCKKFFIDTFGISIGRLHRALKAKIIGNDLRGKMKGSCRKIDEKLVEIAIDHIKSFPHYESHYTRSNNPNKKYLSSDLNLRKMYNLYVKKCEENHTTVLSEQIYRKIFKDNCNLSFHHPHKDTCQKCDYLNMKIKTTSELNEKSSLLEEHSLHLENAELARKALKEDQNLSLTNPDKYFAFSFDLQKALPYPKLTVSVAYYKRNMYVLNEGFHNFHDNKIHMYAWEETTASRGAEEVASCCLKHIQTITTQDHVIAYSDMCTGQNRNIKLALMWLKIVQADNNNINVIDHKFLLSGHSFLPNDRDFAVVETALKKKDQLYTAEDYYNAIKTCRKKNSFILYEMKREDFVSTKPLEEAISNRKKNTDGEIVNWLKICWMRFKRNEPYKIFYKISMEENAPFKTIFLIGKRGRPKNFSTINMLQLYKTSRSITREKYNDMISLLPYIPPIHHQYFNTLTVKENLI